MAGKPKVLCLHGWRTNAAILEFQCRDLLTAADLHFVDAPNPAGGPPQPIIGQVFPGQPYFEWFTKQGGNGEEGEAPIRYGGLDNSLAYVARLESLYGPFTGVLGFSQGGCLASHLCAQASGDRATALLPKLEFGILLSPLFPRAAEVRSVFSAERLAAPFPNSERGGVDVAVVWGESDYLIRDSKTTASYFDGAETLVHARGHEPPNNMNGKPCVERLRALMLRHKKTSAL